MPLRSARQRKDCGKTFLLCFLMTAVTFLPFLIIDKGFFLYCGDFNSQQIPFTYYLENILKNGGANYSWATDLGSGFVESYSFYLLGSPFFWLGRLLPLRWAPYLMVPLLCLKFGAAGAGAFLWARRYTKTAAAAQVAALLYAFSGFALYNTFFNHFIDVVALFPFLLYSVDEFYTRDRRGLFACMAALCLLTNYFFFVGQVLFVVLYFLLHLLGDDWRVSLKKFGIFCFEAVLGVGLAAVLAVPSFLSVIKNPRVDSFSSGLNLLFYSKTQQYLAIFTSLFLPQDPPYMPNLFSDCSIKWTSMAVYLPFFGMSGVLTWLRTRKKTTFSRLVILCAVMAAVPILNSAFYAFNSSYYCRWYYMAILVMGVCTAVSLESAPRRDWLASARVCLGITLGYLIFALIPKQGEDGGYTLGVLDDGVRFFLTLGLAAVSAFAVYMLLKKASTRRALLRGALYGTVVLAVVLGIYNVACGKFPQKESDANYKAETYDSCRELGDWLDAADTNYYRIDAYECYSDIGLWVNRSCLQFFNSTVDSSIMKFYPMVGVKRDVSSKPELSNFALRGLLNVKYLVMPTVKLEAFNQSAAYVDDYTLRANVGSYTILENKYYVPFGTTYSYYVTQEQYEGLSEKSRASLLMRALVLSDEQIEKYGSLLTPIQETGSAAYSHYAYEQDVNDRRAGACTSFVTDTNGFTASASLEKENLVFFSVPYNKGWTATVNGEEVEVEEVDDGLMAVLCPEGDSLIRFEYRAPGLALGRRVTGASFIVLALYMVLLFAFTRKRRVPAASALGEELPEEELPAWQPLPPAQPEEGAPSDEPAPADEPMAADEPDSAPAESAPADETESVLPEPAPTADVGQNAPPKTQDMPGQSMDL